MQFPLMRRKTQEQLDTTSFAYAAGMDYDAHEWQKICSWMNRVMTKETHFGNELELAKDPILKGYIGVIQNWGSMYLRFTQGGGRLGNRAKISERNNMGWTLIFENAMTSIQEFGITHDDKCWIVPPRKDATTGKIIKRGVLSVYCPHNGVVEDIDDLIWAFMVLAPKSITDQVAGFRPVTPQVVSQQKGYYGGEGVPPTPMPEEEQQTALPHIKENQDK